ncbi:MAG: acyltransferase [Lachnospiraceae bacterium]|nr:acyltransferase [Lachnospiraceae bacterium]
MKNRVSRIDNFKWIAALLVAANHTSPLESIHITADFLLTGVVARLAVPFFFMVTGYFVLSGQYGRSDKAGSKERTGRQAYTKIWHSIRKTGLLYLAATILYLPIQIYKFIQGIKVAEVLQNEAAVQQLVTSENVQGVDIVGNILKVIVFEGTYYHLWYLPAAMLGMCVVVLLLRYLPKQAMTISIVLYGVGLLGDSYYGAIVGIPLLKSVYDGIFIVFSYTRNGLFMAPLFLLLGRKIALDKISEENGQLKGERLENKKEVRSLRNFVATLIFMCVEGLVLYKANMQKHSSMYLLLPLCMWYLFSYLAVEKADKVKRGTFFYEGPMVFYIVHPFAILVVRGFVKVTKLTALLTISPLYYVVVVACGLCGSYMILWGRQYMKSRWKGRHKRCT